MREIITICTSYKFSNEAIECYKKLTDMGYIVLFPAMGCSEHDKEWYMNMHFEKIKMSNSCLLPKNGNKKMREASFPLFDCFGVKTRYGTP